MAQFFRAFDILLGHGFDQLLSLFGEIVPIAVESLKQRVNAVKIRPQAGVEMPQILLGDLRFDTVENVIQKRVGNLFVHKLPSNRLLRLWPALLSHY